MFEWHFLAANSISSLYLYVFSMLITSSFSPYYKMSQNLFFIVTIHQFLFLNETLNYVIMGFLLSSLLAACVNLYVNEQEAKRNR